MATLLAGALLEADEGRPGDRRLNQGGTAYRLYAPDREVGGVFAPVRANNTTILRRQSV